MSPRPDPGLPPPETIAPDIERIPADLRALPRWVGWRWEDRRKADGCVEHAKVPIDAKTGSRADTTDASTWAPFEVARAAFQRGALAGVGIVLGDGLVGLDLDDVRDRETGTIEPWALDTVRRLDSYAEVSVRGAGVHVLCRGSLPPGRRRRGAVEMYDGGRYFCVSGWKLDGAPERVEERTAEMAEVHARLLGWEEPDGNDSPNGPDSAPIVADPSIVETLRELTGDDEEVLERARRAANGPKFKALYDVGDRSGHLHSDGTPDESRSDAALAEILTFYVGPDSERIERLFSGSAFGQREKWRDRPDYRAGTVRNAIESCRRHGGFYTGTKPKHVPGCVDGPDGIRAEIQDVRRSPTRTNVKATIHVHGEPLSFEFSSTPTAIDRAAREVVSLVGCDLPAARRFLRGLVGRAEAWHTEREGFHPRETAHGIVLREAEKLRLTFVDDKDRAWSEALGKFLYQRQFVERMLASDVIDKLRRTADYYDAKTRAAVIAGAKRLAESTFATIVRSLPDHEDAEDLGPDSKAAREARRVLRDTFHQPGDRLQLGVSLAATALRIRTAALQAEKLDVPLERLAPSVDAWAGLRHGKLTLAIRHDILRQCRVLLPGVHDQRSFGRIMERYGIIEGADTRPGRGDVRARFVSADTVADLSGLDPEHCVGAPTTYDRSSSDDDV